MKPLNRKQTNFLDLAVYSVMFYVVLLPFYEIGWLKIGSIALILAFFAGILNRFLREWYDVKEAQNNAGKVNRVTGERAPTQHDPGAIEYASDYTPHFSPRSIPDKDYKRAPGERAPD